jgi:Leucine-rich repeat (LRR) protein
VSNITKFINSITLSKKTIALTGTSSEDKALKKLLTHNATVGLSTCLDSSRTRLCQQFAYLALIYSTKAENATSWYSSFDECSWEGIACTNGVVTELDLNAPLTDTMSGTLPADVGLWSELVFFRVAGTNVAGTLPTTIGLWSSLTYFSVSANQHTGTVPTEVGAWSSLTQIRLNDNNFIASLPTTILSWASLTSVRLGGNQFTGFLPSAIGQWTGMTYFSIRQNQFAGTLPSQISNWTALTYFGIHDNQFVGSLPTGVVKWQSIAEVYLHGNTRWWERCRLSRWVTATVPKKAGVRISRRIARA